MDRKIKIIGNAHWSVRGSLESDVRLWNWGIAINGEFVVKDTYLQQGTPIAREFYNEIKQYLPPVKLFEEDIIFHEARPYVPLHHEKYNMTFDGGVPGGTWTFQILLEETKNPEEVMKILTKYFPDAFRESSKGYLIPFRFRKIEIGGPDGYNSKGPVLYVPNKGAILYTSSIAGDDEHSGIVTIGVAGFEDGILLSQIREGLEGKHARTGDAYDLSQEVREVDVPEEVFRGIANKARTSYRALDSFKRDAMRLILDLEHRIAQKNPVEC